MLTKDIIFKNYNLKIKKNIKIKKDLILFFTKNTEILKSLSTKYKNNYNKKIINKFKKYKDIRVIGMGGSILGAQSIYDFLKDQIKKNFYFINNLQTNNNFFKNKKKVS